MGIVTITPAEFGMSVFGDSKVPTRISGAQEFSLVKVQSEPNTQRWWRVTLCRLEREVGVSPVGGGQGGTPADPGQSRSTFIGINSFPYSTAAMGNPLWQPQPQRANPICQVSPSSPQVDCSVQIAFGAGGSQLARMIADWPWLGGSIVVYGSQIEVIGGFRTTAVGFIGDGTMPRFTAFITPVDGVNTSDSGELSLTQSLPLIQSNGATIEGGVVYVPDFARRVKVSLTVGQGEVGYWPDVNVNPGIIPNSGDIGVVCAWLDERGIAIDQFFQGTPNVANTVTPTWQPVPARATMLAVLPTDKTAAQSTMEALINWRISP